MWGDITESPSPFDKQIICDGRRTLLICCSSLVYIVYISISTLSSGHCKDGKIELGEKFTFVRVTGSATDEDVMVRGAVVDGMDSGEI